MSERPSQPSRAKGRRAGSSRQHLSAATLEKKRLADRESQRAGRERTRNRIRHLETLVESLEKTEDNDRVKAFARYCHELRQQNERLMSVISNVGRTCRSIELPDTAGTDRDPSVSSPGAAFDGITEPATLKLQPLDGATAPEMRASVLAPQEEPDSLWPQTSLDVADESRLMASNPPLFYPDSSAPDLFSSTRRQASLSQNSHAVAPGTFPDPEAASEITAEVISNSIARAELSAILSTQPAEDADIAIRAVLDGWHSVKQIYSLDDGWDILCKIDQQVFLRCGIIERLAILRVMRLKLRSAVDASPENLERLPSFMHKRPTQTLIQHPSMIDYFVWPDLRDLLILSPTGGQKKEDTKKFISIFPESIRFQWPNDLSDVWTKNPYSGAYSFSRAFSRRFEDIRSWMLSSDFFTLCPQLIGYIPIHNPGPGRVLGDFLADDDFNRAAVEQEQRAQSDTDELDWPDVLHAP